VPETDRPPSMRKALYSSDPSSTGPSWLSVETRVFHVRLGILALVWVACVNCGVSFLFLCSFVAMSSLLVVVDLFGVVVVAVDIRKEYP